MVLSKKALLFIPVILLLIFSSGCRQAENVSESQEPAEEEQIIGEVPEDFNFSLSYGTYGKQRVDTFEDIVVKDLVEDGTIEADISLSQNEMEQIYHEMLIMDIMAITEEDLNETYATEPPSFSEWTIHMNNTTNSFSVNNYSEELGTVAELRELEAHIHDIVSSKEEYKELPMSVGGYE